MSQNCGSFYWFISSGSFFFLLTQAEKRAFSQLKALISAEVRKKRTSKKNCNFETCKPAICNRHRTIVAKIELEVQVIINSLPVNVADADSYNFEYSKLCACVFRRN